jgi:hypothetical protein
LASNLAIVGRNRFGAMRLERVGGLALGLLLWGLLLTGDALAQEGDSKRSNLGLKVDYICEAHARLPLERRRGVQFEFRSGPAGADARGGAHVRQKRPRGAPRTPDDEQTVRLHWMLANAFCADGLPWTGTCNALRASASGDLPIEQASIRQALARDAIVWVCQRNYNPTRQPACLRLGDLFSKLVTVNDHNASIVAAQLYERLRLESGLEPKCGEASASPSARLAVSALYACHLERDAGHVTAERCPIGEMVSELARSIKPEPTPEVTASAINVALRLWALEAPELSPEEQLELTVEAALDAMPWWWSDSPIKRQLVGLIRAELEGDTVAVLAIAGALDPKRRLDDSGVSAWGALRAALDDKAEAVAKEREQRNAVKVPTYRFGLGVAASLIGGVQWPDIDGGSPKRVPKYTAMLPLSTPIGLAYQRTCCFWWAVSPLDPAQYLTQSIANRLQPKPLDLIAPSMTVAGAPRGWSGFYVGVSSGVSRAVYSDIGAYVGGVVGVGWVLVPFSKAE